ncbi:growth hormone secretagogue receptor type 1-like isoform X1 [Salmo trutta]|uniref:Growth hormone secretagogue receptor type 1 n=1 Tax=Salmo trutta TaxID=8032 RepID=A0A674CH83_SALTR|nr:growth hormone secretagogue receptor type 1-like isoform X1 [Salmo trutta]
MRSWPNRTDCLSPVNCSWEDNYWNYYFNGSYRGSVPPENLFPIPVLMGITITCALLFLAGLTGNVMTILVVSKYRDMRTTTNLYLCSMAVSDLLIFLCMPPDVYRLWKYRPWIFGDTFCKLFQFVSECCTYSTILNITALSVERYLAICFPLRAKRLVTKRRVRALILFLWLVSLLSAGPVFVLVGVEHETRPAAGNSVSAGGAEGQTEIDTSECKPTRYAVESGLLAAMALVSSVFFFLPVFCLTVVYSLIGRRLWKRRRENNIGANVAHRDKSNRQTVKMLAVVVFAFVLCWLPFHLHRYLMSHSSEGSSPLWSLFTQYCSLVSTVLFYLSAAINPVLYNTMSRKYRSAAAQLFGLQETQPPRGRTASTVKGESSPAWTESTVSL